jgi:hypothetical protein
MASKSLIDIALKLSKQLGANTNKFLGSRSNISFLGKGPKDDLLFQQDINVEALGAFPLNKLLPQIESSMGYLTGGKLNDIQANKLIANMEKIKEFNFPTAAPANIIDMGTGTRNLTDEGLGALRATRKTDDDLRIIKDEVQTQDPNFIPMRAEQYKDVFGKSPELGVVKKGSNEIDALETMTKNKAGTEFITGFVDDVYKNSGVTASVDIAKKRAAAREFLFTMLKKETDLLPQGGTLESVINPTDYKYVMEGGGGALGDPLILVKKYFGDTIAKRLPLNSDREVIETFVDNVRFTKDRAGFATDDPRFNPDDLPEFAGGGRAGFKFGGLGRFTKAEVLIQRLKNTIKDSQGKKDELSVYVNKTFPGFIDEIKADPKLAENEQVWKTLGLDLPKDQRLVVHSDDTVDFFTQTKFGPHNIKNVEKFMAEHPFLSREDALRILKMEPEDRVLEITRLQVLNNRTKNAHGGLAKILEV